MGLRQPDIGAPAQAERKRIEDGLVVSAVRYALGRATYVVEETVRWLEEHWGDLHPGTRTVILRDVTRALAEDRAGLDCDRAAWQRIAYLAPDTLAADIAERIRARSTDTRKGTHGSE